MTRKEQKVRGNVNRSLFGTSGEIDVSKTVGLLMLAELNLQWCPRTTDHSHIRVGPRWTEGSNFFKYWMNNPNHLEKREDRFSEKDQKSLPKNSTGRMSQRWELPRSNWMIAVRVRWSTHRTWWMKWRDLLLETHRKPTETVIDNGI